jgi:pre-rRNA-processing protein IPI3
MLQEVVLCASGPTQGNTSLGSVSLNDITTTNSVFSLKQTGAARNGYALVQTRNGQGGFVLAAQADKGLLNVYSFQKVNITWCLYTLAN